MPRLQRRTISASAAQWPRESSSRSAAAHAARQLSLPGHAIGFDATDSGPVSTYCSGRIRDVRRASFNFELQGEPR